MMSRKIGFLLIAFLLTLWSWGLPISAQTMEAEKILVNSIEEDSQGDSLDLNVYFTLLDENGGPTAADAKSAELIFQKDVIPAGLKNLADDETTKLYIGMVLDLSGSMKPHLEAMKKAATDAIEASPAGTRFSITTFNGPGTFIPSDFLSKESAKQEIAQISMAEGGTCLYDATAASLTKIGSENLDPKSQRPALIVFTDGKDLLDINNPNIPCSTNYTFDNLISFAKSQESPVPIYTIGLGDSDPNVGKLAEETGGIFIPVQQSASPDLSSAFQEIMAGLKNQWRATITVYPENAGAKTAKFIITTGENQFITPITFDSDKAYQKPSNEEFRFLTVSQPVQNKAGNNYSVEFTVQKIDAAKSWEIEIIGTEDGISVLTLPRTISNSSSADQTIEFDATELGFENLYELTLYAKGETGEYLKDENGDRISSKPIRFKHWSNESLVVTIGRVEIDEENQALLVPIDVIGNTEGVVYNWYLINDENNDTNRNPTVETVKLNQEYKIIMGRAKGKYRIEVDAKNADGTTIGSDKMEEPINYGLPFFDLSRLKISHWIVIIALFLMIFLLLIFNRWRNEKREHPLAVLHQEGVKSSGKQKLEEEIKKTMVDAEAESASSANSPVSPDQPVARPHIVCIESPATNISSGQSIKIENFPFTIGRSDCSINLLNDPHISRQHVTITQQAGYYYLIDSGSTNGCFVNGNRVPAQQQIRLQSGNIIQLGRKTQFKFFDH